MKASRLGILSALTAFVLVAFFAPRLAFAATVKTGGDVQFGSADSASGNVYVVAGRATVAGSVDGDLVIASAADAVVSGAVGGDLTVLGYRTAVSGSVGGDLRVVSGFVTVSGKVAGDLVVAGGQVTVMPEAQIGGDFVVAAGDLYSRGDVSGGADLLAGTAAVGGRVARGGTVTAPSVTFLSDARGGSVSYYAQSPATIESGAALASLSYNQIPPISEIGPVRRGILSFLTLWRFFSFASTLVLGLALAYGAKVFSQEAAAIGSRGLWAFLGSFAAGLATIVFLPLVSLLAIASIFALPLGILGLLAAVAVAVLASALGAIVVGFAVERALRRGAEVTVSYRAVALGAVTVALIDLVPVAPAFKVVVALAGVGAAARVAARRLRGEGWSIDKVIERWGGSSR